MVQMNLSAGRNEDVENRCGHRGRKGWMNWENGIDIYTSMCKTANGKLCIALEPQLGALWGPRWTGWGSGREIPKRDVCILVADSL